jgi:hypothetical protein
VALSDIALSDGMLLLSVARMAEFQGESHALSQSTTVEKPSIFEEIVSGSVSDPVRFMPDRWI